MPIKTLGKAAEGGGDAAATTAASDSSPAASGPSIIPSQVSIFNLITNVLVSTTWMFVDPF